MKRSEFLADLFYFAREKNILIALARPYTGDVMQGDIDLLIESKNIAFIDAFISQQSMLKKTSHYFRADGETCHLFGVENGTAQAIGLDLISSLKFQGISYLDIKHVLERTVTDGTGIKAPHEIDQALILLMTHGVKHKGAVKQRYLDYIHGVLKKNPVAFPQALVELMGDRATMEFVEAITTNTVSDKLWQHMSRGYLIQAWAKHGLIGLCDKILYKITRLFHMLTTPRMNVAVYGVDGAGKTTLISNLDKTLAMTMTTIRLPHFRPSYPWLREDDSNRILQNPHAKELRGAFTSTLKLVYLLARYWLAYLWPRHGSTLFLYDRYLPDILVDPVRYRYGGSMAVLRAACALLPPVQASILVDIGFEVAQKRKAEVSPAETKRQADAYRQLITSLPNPVSIKGEMPIDRMTAIATAHVIQAMTKHTEK